jgi:hypothetical protein
MTLEKMNCAELANAITDPKTGEYRTRADKEGEVAIVPMLYNRIKRQASRAGQSLTHDEIRYCIEDILARHCADDWHKTNAGKGRAAFTIVATKKVVPARLPMPRPETVEQWLHGLMLAVTRRYVSQRGWLRSDVEIAKREDWRDMFRPSGRAQSLKALPLRVNHHIELDGLPPRFIDAVADGLIDKVDLQIIGVGKSAMKASEGTHQNYDPIKMGAKSIGAIIGETPDEAQNRIDRLIRIDNGQQVKPVAQPIENLRTLTRYSAPQSEYWDSQPAAAEREELPTVWIDANVKPIREDWQAHDWKPTDNKLISRAEVETPAYRIAEYLKQKQETPANS